MIERIHKYCKAHGKKHLVHKDFSLCAHPDCFDAAVYSILKKVPLFQKLQKLDVKDDFRSFLVVKLLKENKEDGKVVALNYRWLVFSMFDFFNGELRNGIVPVEMLPRTERFNQEHVFLSPEILEEIEDISSHLQHIGQSSEKKFLFQEMKHSCESLVGSEMILFLSGEINIQDYARLRCISMIKAKEERKIAIDLLRPLFEGE